MQNTIIAQHDGGLTESAVFDAVSRALAGQNPRRALLIPPDFTRYHSNTGPVTNIAWHLLTQRGCDVDILPALGSHAPLTPEQAATMFGDIPFSRFIAHDCRRDLVTLGVLPGDEIAQFTGGLWREPVTVQISRRVVDPAYGLIISLGQVVPHEVAGMANHAKNLFVGVGGADMIGQTHMIGALCGMEQAMGRDHAPVRRIFDAALERFLPDIPILYALTVCAPQGEVSRTLGLFIGTGRACFDAAVALSRHKNIDIVPRPLQKCVACLPPEEFRTAWLGNKAIYRTRMAMADGGELLILAPGLERFGEDDAADALIRKYGYRGRLQTLAAFQAPENADLRANMGVAAHLIHGSSDGRFRVTYAAPRMTRDEITGAGFGYADYADAIARYDPARLSPGFNTLPGGEEVYFIPNPALGLWRYAGELGVRS